VIQRYNEEHYKIKAELINQMLKQIWADHHIVVCDHCGKIIRQATLEDGMADYPAVRKSHFCSSKCRHAK